MNVVPIYVAFAVEEWTSFRPCTVSANQDIGGNRRAVGEQQLVLSVIKAASFREPVAPPYGVRR
jgi:hypothetical protein